VIALLVAAAVVVMAAARLTRLVTQDSYPPAAWLRARWDDWTEESDWNVLLHCHWCFAPWVVLPLLVGAYFALDLPPFHWSHLLWLFLSWMAMSYVASWIVNNDEGLVIVKEDH